LAFSPSKCPTDLSSLKKRMEISYSRFSPVAGEKTDITDSLTSIGVFAWLLLSNALPHHASA
ncbi:MAG: hypothetical protein KHY68_07025, partial [Collinsella sp.]|nr:hypothetical protein [Collinsella sp.]